MKMKHVVLAVGGAAAAWGLWKLWGSYQMGAKGPQKVTLVGGVPTTIPKDAQLKDNAARFTGRPDIAARREASAEAASMQQKAMGNIKGAAERSQGRTAALINNLGDSSQTSKATKGAANTQAARAVTTGKAADQAVANLVTHASRKKFW